MSQLTGTQMKYLHVIYMVQEDEGGIRSVDIARELGVTKASVCRMIKLLTRLELIFVKKSGNITLTPKGKNVGTEIHEKIIRIYPFFADYLELEEPEALSSTYSFLCGFSDYCIEKLLWKGWAVSQTPV